MTNKIENRKSEIIRIAAKLFKEKGYSAVTMRDLAAEMGIKAASLYNHIRSKEDILNTIIISIAEAFTDGMKLIKASNDNCKEKLRQIIELHVRLSSQNIYGMASLNNDWMHLQNQQEYYKVLRANYENDFRKILEEGITSGDLINVKPEVMLFSILTTLRSLYLWIPKKEDLDLQELSETLYQILVEGINK
ncbi:TetR/AcrR family transcriptional regulator [Winogradskyella aquimaris]|uniref:TetR/AcrR family transcriptional regulator n=1 Tax=Winogradskyella aquimaris TaxID=864074 RepID=A0ABU5ELF5_9FLAO|nr:TetR/AcrR family transcriptional regulator [Winogradskyella aquimaris]MDY2585721.1 TetR/AcrR family transcriptional regulator [Winogradskyella aquimaris]